MQITRYSDVDIQAGRYGGAKGADPTTMRISRAERWAKLVAAFALSAIVGMGAYTATYRGPDAHIRARHGGVGGADRIGEPRP